MGDGVHAHIICIFWNVEIRGHDPVDLHLDLHARVFLGSYFSNIGLGCPSLMDCTSNGTYYQDIIHSHL